MKKFFIFFVVLCAGLHLSAMATEESGVTFTGVVKSDTEVLPYASIASVTEVGKGCTTVDDGTFNCEKMPEDGKVRVFYIGYETVEITLKQNENNEIILEEDDPYVLPEVEVTGERVAVKEGENNVEKIDSNECEITKCEDGYGISDGKQSYVQNEIDPKELKQAEDDYKAARDKEQSKENKMLTAGTVAATGIGGMELARGLAEQSADRKSAAAMDAYIGTMRCEYGDGKSVKTIDVKDTSIELPGGNDLTQLRTQYLALAGDLKARKTALGMKPGIESEEILDKSQLGLYDDENTGITSGHEASLYRAQMYESETDQSKLDDAAKKSQNRVIGGAIAAGVGVAGGIVGDSAINGKLGEKIKENKDRKSIISEFTKGLESKGFKNIKDLDLSKIDISTLTKLQNIDWTKVNIGSETDITQILNTTNSTSFISSFSTLGLGNIF